MRQKRKFLSELSIQIPKQFSRLPLLSAFKPCSFLPVLFRLTKSLVVACLIFMVGGHWAILQTAAWVGMAVNYSQDASLTSALAKTFDGKRPCKLCKFVSEGKKSERKSETQLDGKK